MIWSEPVKFWLMMLVKYVSIESYLAATCASVVHWLISNARVVVLMTWLLYGLQGEG